MANPFGITEVDVAGVFGKVQQAKTNALNFDIAQENLNAFRQSQESQKQLAAIRSRAIAGDQGAVEQLATIDPGEATDVIDFFSKTDKLGRERATQTALDMARIGVEFLEALPEDRPAILERARKRFPDSADLITDNITEQQARTLVRNAQSAVTLMDIINPDKRTPNTIAIGSLNAQGQLVTEQIIDMNNHPDPIGFLNRAAQEGKAIFDPEEAGAGQGLGTPTQRADFDEELRNSAALLTSTDRLLEILDEGGAGIVGPTGFLQRAADTIGEQIDAAADAFGFSQSVSAGDIDINTIDFSVFGDAAALSAGFKSVAARTAFLIAESNDPGARKTNEDIERAFDQMGIGSGSTNQIRAALREVQLFEVERVQNRINQSGRQDVTLESFREDFGLRGGRLDTVFNGETRGTGQAEFDRLLASGTVDEILAFSTEENLASLSREQKENLLERLNQIGG